MAELRRGTTVHEVGDSRLRAPVTAHGPDYVDAEARVAVFDNDGTLWCEKPMYIQLDFIVRRLGRKGGGERAGRAAAVQGGPSAVI